MEDCVGNISKFHNKQDSCQPIMGGPLRTDT